MMDLPFGLNLVRIQLNFLQKNISCKYRLDGQFLLSQNPLARFQVSQAIAIKRLKIKIYPRRIEKKIQERYDDERMKKKPLIRSWVNPPLQNQLSCSGSTNSVPIKTNPTNIPMIQMLDLIFDFHICQGLFLPVLVLCSAPLVRNQRTSVE